MVWRSLASWDLSALSAAGAQPLALVAQWSQQLPETPNQAGVRVINEAVARSDIQIGGRWPALGRAQHIRMALFLGHFLVTQSVGNVAASGEFVEGYVIDHGI